MNLTGNSKPDRLGLEHRSLGAQIQQASLGDGLDIFYLSPLSTNSALPAPARGGVPVLFPQFAELGPLPKHGFARSAEWRVVQDVSSETSKSVCQVLDIHPGQYAGWPHAARLEMRADIAPGALRLRLQVTNTGASAFTWTGGLHPYFAVDDVQACTVAGLTGLPVQDRYNANLAAQPGGPPGWGSQPFERLYGTCPPLTLFTGSRRLELTATGFDQWMVWNPSQADGDALSDLPSGDWRRFICIEPVCVSRPVSLLPGEVFAGTLDVRLLPDASGLGETA